MNKSDVDSAIAKAAKVDFKKALVNPAASFENPKQLLDNDFLSRQQKIEILRRWEYDVRELQVADDEGMTAPKPPSVTLESIFAALRKLGAPPGIEHSAPTKQGGS